MSDAHPPHAAEDPPHEVRAASVYRLPGFGPFLGATFVSAVGDQMVDLALPILVLAITGSAARAGLVAAVEGLPLLFGPFAGALADSVDRRRLMVGAELVAAVAVGCLALLAWLESLPIAVIYTAVLVEASATTLFFSGKYAVIASLVPRPRLPEATAAMSASDSLARLGGPLLAGFLLTGGSVLHSAGTTFAVDAASFVVISAVIARSMTAVAATPVRRDGPGLLTATRDGLRLLVADSRLRRLMLLGMSRLLVVTPAFLGIVLLCQRALRAPPDAIGVVIAIGAMGGLLGSALAPRVARSLSVRSVAIGTTSLMALAFAGMAFSWDVAGVAVAESVFSTAYPISNASLLAYRMGLIPAEMQGRVNASYRSIIYICVPVGAAAGGFLLDGVGPRSTFMVLTGALLPVLLLATRVGQDPG